MKAKEIKIGNLVNLYGTTATIQGVDFVNNYNGSDRKFDRFKPIPLTEDWLLRLGFLRLGEGFEFWESSAFNIEFMNNLWCISYTSSILCTHIKHVHQLQNLYFALTGTELTL